MPYKNLLSIRKRKFTNKTILIIGAGWMGKQYCQALAQMGIRDVCILSRSEKSAKACCEEYSFQSYYGGYETCLESLGIFDLVIITMPVNELLSAALKAIECGNKNILIEKPGSLYSSVLFELAKHLNDRNLRIRIAYNRLVYPNLWRLKELAQDDGGITSCRYTFTELVHTINFNNNQNEVYERWGVANSLHVISMAHSLIGFPKEIQTCQLGKLDWHSSGDRFIGMGISQDEIPFSYHADWGSAGRWGIEIMTPQNAYRLMPLEELYTCKKGTFDWEIIETTSAFPTVKQGVAEEIAVMLDISIEENIALVDLQKGAQLTALAEKIFGYDSKGRCSF